MAHTLERLHPFVLGDWAEPDMTSTVLDKYDETAVTEIGLLDRPRLDGAVTALAHRWSASRWPVRARAAALQEAARLLGARQADFVHRVMVDTGFVRADAEREVGRSIDTLRLCAEEALRLVGEVVPIGSAPGNEGRHALTTWHPRGVVAAITPFNAPLNTVIHKVGPALAAGNAVVLKPAEQTPRCADGLIRTLLDAGVPPDLLALVYGSGATTGRWLTEHPAPAFYAFTGSTAVGETIARTVGLRRCQLELGSISSTIVCADANLERALQLTLQAGYRKAGQVCTSVQRLYVDASIAGDVIAELGRMVGGLVAGDPAAPETSVGPVISRQAAERVESMLVDATDRGAQVAAGGGRWGTVVRPTLLCDVPKDARIMREELFGPAVVVRPFTDLAQAIDEINDTPYGLAAGIFTRDIDRALQAASDLRMGSVHINQTSSSRADLMPYTGVKRSGSGIEGPHHAIREMSELRVVTIGPG